MPGKSNREYRVWHASEEEALRRGVKKHGLGAWEVIRTDPDFSVLSCRSGVQLKDKWRNLVKFKHVTQADIQALQRRTSGPWSKKYGLQQRKPAADEPAGGSAAAKAGDPEEAEQQQQQQQEEGDELAGAGSLAVADRPRRRTAGTRAYNFDTSSSSTSDPGLGEDGRPVKRTCAAEDRRFGIYDQRRYEKLAGGAADPQHQGPPSPNAGGGRVDCLCGVRHDDGKLMIECERCSCWAHPECLERLQQQHPDQFRFTFENYICKSCQDQTARLAPHRQPHPLSGSDTDGSDHFYQYPADRPPPNGPPLHWAARGRRGPNRPRSNLPSVPPLDPSAPPPSWGGTLALTQTLPPVATPPSPTTDPRAPDPMHWLRAPAPKPAKTTSLPPSSRSAFQPCPATPSTGPPSHYGAPSGSRPHLARAATMPTTHSHRSLTQITKPHPTRPDSASPFAAVPPPARGPRPSPFTLPPSSGAPPQPLLPHLLALHHRPTPTPPPGPSSLSPPPPSAFRSAAAAAFSPLSPADPPPSLPSHPSLDHNNTGLSILASAAVKAEPADAGLAEMYGRWAEKDCSPAEAVAEALEAASSLPNPLPTSPSLPGPGGPAQPPPLTMCRSASNSILLVDGDNEGGSRELDPSEEIWPHSVAQDLPLTLLPDNPTPPPALPALPGPPGARDPSGGPPDSLWGTGDILPPSLPISNPRTATPYCPSPGLPTALRPPSKPLPPADAAPPSHHHPAPLTSFSESLPSTSSTGTQYSLQTLNSRGGLDPNLPHMPRPLSLTAADPSLPPSLYAIYSCPSFPIAPHPPPNLTSLARLSTPDGLSSRPPPYPANPPLRYLDLPTSLAASRAPPPTLSCPSYPPPTHTFLSSHHNPPPILPPNPNHSPFALPAHAPAPANPPFPATRLHALASHPLHPLRDPLSSFKRYQPPPRDPTPLAQLLSDPSSFGPLPAGLLNGRRTPPYFPSGPPLTLRQEALHALPSLHAAAMAPLPDDYPGAFGAPGGMPLL